MIKLDKVYRSNISILTSRGDIRGYEESAWYFKEWLDKHYPNQALRDGIYFRMKVHYKIGRRRKLKSLVVYYYNKIKCDCCGPYFVIQVMK